MKRPLWAAFAYFDQEYNQSILHLKGVIDLDAIKYWWDVGLPEDATGRFFHHAAIRQEVTLEGRNAREAIESAFQGFFAEKGEIIPFPATKVRRHYFVAFCRSSNHYYLIAACNAKQAQTYLYRAKGTNCDWIADVYACCLCLSDTVHASA